MSLWRYFGELVRRSFHGAFRIVEIAEAAAAVLCHAAAWFWPEYRDVLEPISVGILIVFVLTFVFGLIVAAHGMHREEEAARTAAEGKLKPKVEIVAGEIFANRACRIIVRCVSEGGCRFGLDLKAIKPGVTGLVLPVPLAIVHEPPGQAMAWIPGGQERRVDVCQITDAADNLFLITASSHIGIPRADYEMTFVAHADGGASVSRMFRVRDHGQALDFHE